MVDRKLVKEEMKKRGVTQYKSIVPSLSRLKKLFCRYEVETIAECYYDADEYGADQICVNNWVDILSEGLWEMSQSDVDSTAWYFVRKMRKYPHLDRWYLCKENGCWGLYIYGRDIWEESYRDFWIWFRPRRKGLHMKWSRKDTEAED